MPARTCRVPELEPDLALVLVRTRHGVLPVHPRWFVNPELSIHRWLKAGKPQAPRTGPYLVAPGGRMVRIRWHDGATT